jgi:hypothetical protein
MYHFDFNSKWVINQFPTKRIAVRKIEIFPMLFTTIARFIFDIHHSVESIIDLKIFSLHDNKIIIKYLDYLIGKMNNNLNMHYFNKNYVILYTDCNSDLMIIRSIPYYSFNF